MLGRLKWITGSAGTWGWDVGVGSWMGVGTVGMQSLLERLGFWDFLSIGSKDDLKWSKMSILSCPEVRLGGHHGPESRADHGWAPTEEVKLLWSLLLQTIVKRPWWSRDPEEERGILWNSAWFFSAVSGLVYVGSCRIPNVRHVRLSRRLFRDDLGLVWLVLFDYWKSIWKSMIFFWKSGHWSFLIFLRIQNAQEEDNILCTTLLVGLGPTDEARKFSPMKSHIGCRPPMPHWLNMSGLLSRFYSTTLCPSIPAPLCQCNRWWKYWKRELQKQITRYGMWMHVNALRLKAIFFHGRVKMLLKL